MAPEKIERVVVVGAGIMGRQIALQCAVAGFDVGIHDSSDAVRRCVVDELHRVATRMSEEADVAPRDAAAAVERIAVIEDLRAVRGADLVIESIPEDLDLKRRLLAELDRFVGSDALIVTNTSSFVPSMLARESGRPDCFAALHFHPPVWSTRYVDLMPHPGTAPSTVERLDLFVRAIGCEPLPYPREYPGYIFNAILGAMHREAMLLVINGVAEIPTIDDVWTTVSGMRVGPFRHMDEIGLDTVWGVVREWGEIAGNRQSRRIAEFIGAYVERGDLGCKSGRGFYDYRDA